MIPFLKEMEKLVTDAGYASEENYRYLDEKERLTYIKPMDHEKVKARKF